MSYYCLVQSDGILLLPRTKAIEQRELHWLSLGHTCYGAIETRPTATRPALQLQSPPSTSHLNQSES